MDGSLVELEVRFAMKSIVFLKAFLESSVSAQHTFTCLTCSSIGYSLGWANFYVISAKNIIFVFHRVSIAEFIGSATEIIVAQKLLAV